MMEGLHGMHRRWRLQWLIDRYLHRDGIEAGSLAVRYSHRR